MISYIFCDGVGFVHLDRRLFGVGVRLSCQDMAMFAFAFAVFCSIPLLGFVSFLIHGI